MRKSGNGTTQNIDELDPDSWRSESVGQVSHWTGGVKSPARHFWQTTLCLRSLVRGGPRKKNLGLSAITVVELGVAGGRGLVALQVARLMEDHYGIGIHVAGFDSGQGMPSPVDYRDDRTSGAQDFTGWMPPS